MSANHLLAAELNVTAALISLAIGSTLLAAVAVIDRRVQRLEGDKASVPEVVPAIGPVAPPSVAPTASTPPQFAEPPGVIDLTESDALVDALPPPHPIVDADDYVFEEFEEEPRSPLPRGAEAAILSIVETIADPRNTFATKDPTAEVTVRPRVASAAKPAASRPSPAAPTRVSPASRPGSGRWTTAADAPVGMKPADLRPGPPEEWGSRNVPIIDAPTAPTVGPTALTDDTVNH